MLELPLSALESWMQSVIVHPGGIEDALAATEARKQLSPEDIEEVILPSRSLNAAARLGIYQGMYLLRMEEALATDYPGLALERPGPRPSQDQLFRWFRGFVGEGLFREVRLP